MCWTLYIFVYFAFTELLLLKYYLAHFFFKLKINWHE